MGLGRLAAKVALSALLGALIGGLLLGLFGLVVAGWEGAQNAAVWGVALGLFAGIGTAGGIVQWAYWGDFVKRIGEARRDQ